MRDESTSGLLERALRHRRRQCAEWGTGSVTPGSFERLIRRTWIAFLECFDAR